MQSIDVEIWCIEKKYQLCICHKKFLNIIMKNYLYKITFLSLKRNNLFSIYPTDQSLQPWIHELVQPECYISQCIKAAHNPLVQCRDWLTYKIRHFWRYLYTVLCFTKLYNIIYLKEKENVGLIDKLNIEVIEIILQPTNALCWIVFWRNTKMVAWQDCILSWNHHCKLH